MLEYVKQHGRFSINSKYCKVYYYFRQTEQRNSLSPQSHPLNLRYWQVNGFKILMNYDDDGMTEQRAVSGKNTGGMQ